MITINLLVEEDYIETLMDELPKDKVIVIEKEFEQNRELLALQLENYENKSTELISYFDSMKELSIWLKAKEE